MTVTCNEIHVRPLEGVDSKHLTPAAFNYKLSLQTIIITSRGFIHIIFIDQVNLNVHTTKLSNE